MHSVKPLRSWSVSIPGQPGPTLPVARHGEGTYHEMDASPHSQGTFQCGAREKRNCSGLVHNWTLNPRSRVPARVGEARTVAREVANALAFIPVETELT
jgi:hypothetical protein